MLKYRNLNNVSAMEIGNHFKNGANLKSQTSRELIKPSKMKNLIYSMIAVSVLFFSQGVNAQISLEQTFNEIVSYEENISLYTYYNAEENEVRLYNHDYSLYKTITITPPANYPIGEVFLFCRNIFTTDDKITFFVNFGDGSGEPSNSYSTLRLYDENGSKLKDFGYAYLFYDPPLSPTIHMTSNYEYRLSVPCLMKESRTAPITYKTEIYSLPGTVIDLGSTQQVENTLSPYPNPASTVITLPYQLEQGETSVMRIYSADGQLIETKQIDFVFNKILLNVSSYAKGIYFYEVNGVSSKFIVN